MARLRTPLLQSTYQWILDQGLTPHVLVDASVEGVIVPREYIDEGQILFNVSDTAVRGFHIQEAIQFEASFNGSLWQIHIPVQAVLALYAEETDQGLYAKEEGLGLWVHEGESEQDLDPSQQRKPENTGKGPKLRLV